MMVCLRIQPAPVQNAVINIETTVENKNLLNTGCMVSSVITDRNGKVIGRSSDQSLVLAVNESKTVKTKYKCGTSKVVVFGRPLSAQDNHFDKV
jgi:hypothetical protein